MLTQLRTPQALVVATIQPVIFVLLFRYAFGAGHIPMAPRSRRVPGMSDPPPTVDLCSRRLHGA